MSYDDILYGDDLGKPPSGGGFGDRTEFFKPHTEPAGAHNVRIYRFCVEGDETKRLFHIRHHHVLSTKPYKTVACEGPGCTFCAQSDTMRAMDSKDEQQQGWDMRRQAKCEVCLVRSGADAPQFEVWDTSLPRVKDIMLAIARLGGWEGTFPENGDPQQEPEKHAQFKAFMELVHTTADQVCGPEGYDLTITYGGKAVAANQRYTVGSRVPPMGNDAVCRKKLPLSEDDTPDLAARREALSGARKG